MAKKPDVSLVWVKHKCTRCKKEGERMAVQLRGKISNPTRSVKWNLTQQFTKPGTRLGCLVGNHDWKDT